MATSGLDGRFCFVLIGGAFVDLIGGALLLTWALLLFVQSKMFGRGCWCQHVQSCLH
jgi:hypothetical protein